MRCLADLAPWREDPEGHGILFDAGGVLVTLDHPLLARLAAEVVEGPTPDAACFEAADWRAHPRLDPFLRGRSTEVGDTRLRYGELLWDEAWALFERPRPSDAHLRCWLERLLRAHEKANLWCRVPPGTEEALERLAAAGHPMAVISNADGRVEALLAERGLTRTMSFVLDSALEGVEKPDGEIFRRGVARLGLEAARCLYVGDFLAVDVEGARGAGLRAVLVDPGRAWKAEGVLSFPDLGSLAAALDGERPPRPR